MNNLAKNRVSQRRKMMNKSKGYKRSVLLQTIALAGIILSNAITAAAPALADVSAPVVTVSPTTL